MSTLSFTSTRPTLSFSTAPPPRLHHHHHHTKPLTTTRAINIDNVSYQDGAYKIEGVLLTPASPDLVYSVLSDYSSLPSIFSNISSCSLMPHYKDDDSKYISQTCTWEIFNGMFKGDFITDLVVVENSSERKLSFSLVDSAFMKEFIGGWSITPYSSSSSSNNKHHYRQPSSHVRHSLKVTPTVSPPQKIGDLTKQIFVAQVEGILTDLEQELNRRYNDGSGDGGIEKEGGQKAVTV
jgi:ribosome-associated toxin RatA of RatAB toxin-antitoxin module